MNIYDVLSDIRRRPHLFLREPSVEHLDSFMQGLLYGNGRDELLLAKPSFDHFGYWLAAMDGCGLDGRGWGRWFDGDLDRFFAALDQFREDTLRVVDRANKGSKARWPQAGTWTINGVLMTGSDPPPIDTVELRSYSNCESFFIHILYTDGSEYERWCWTRARALALAHEALGIDVDAWTHR